MEALRERFGKYHVLEKIAQGGMAEVYKVKTVGIAGFEKVQALKRILPSSAREGRFIRSFIDEARIAVELTHRNIVQVFDFGKADGELFLAMELIEGKDLRTAMAQAVARDALPPIAVAAHIIAEVAAGLDYAHRKTDGYGGSLGIVHCDVSPSNVMLSTDGYVKILDFGIARATFASALERRRLRGKPRYMAPEQTLGEPPTAAADVFALGIIAWELMTGLPLFRGPDLKSILEAVRRTEPPRLDTLNTDIPAEIVEAVAVALRRDPPARGTAADLATACARSAMKASSRQIAAWLVEIEKRPTHADISWGASTRSVSVPPPPGAEGAPRPSTMSTASIDQRALPPAPRPSTMSTASIDQHALPPARDSSTAPANRPSLTVSLANLPVPAADFGEGTHDAPDLHEQPTAPARGSRDRFEHPEVTATSTRPMPKLEPEPSTGPHPRFVAAATLVTPPPVTWRNEGTASGVGRLVDVLPLGMSEVATDVAPHGHVETEPYQRPSFATIVPDGEPPLRPSLARFDDLLEVGEATSFGIALPHDHATSYDEPLEVEASGDIVAPGPDALHDEAIDDDLGALQTGLTLERRRAVVVAGLLSGGSAGEDLRQVARSLGELAYQRGGVVIALDEDALVVAFGLEVAGEDDVAVAMGWALDAGALARDAGTDHADGMGGAIELRLGARAGVVTHAGRSSSTDAGMRDAGPRLPGDAIEEVRLLAREAAPGRPLFIGATGRLTSGLYELREVPGRRAAMRPSQRGRVARRSRSGGASVLELIGPRGFGDRDRARFERRGKFVGRTVQLAELEVWLQRAIAADRRLALTIVGAAGTGKSRLVAELIARRAAAGVPLRVVTTAASPASRLAPFALVIDLYQAALGLPPARGRAARAQAVQRLLHVLSTARVPRERARAVATDLDRAMELRDGVGVGAPEVADLRPRLSAGIATFRLALVDRHRPVLTVIEDIHHADSASLEVIRHALAAPASGPELLVLTARPEDAATEWTVSGSGRWASRDSEAHTGRAPATDAVLSIGDLVGGELRALIADRLGDAASPLNIAAVLARGGGNPLFIEELAQAVRDAGPSADEVPASARDVVSARIERLSPTARTALRYAAVLGGTVRWRLVEELLATEELGNDALSGDDSLDDVEGRDAELEELVRAGFLVRPESAPDGELLFARGLVREVVYEALSARAQRESHARVGRLLASRFFAGREEPPAEIAEHLEAGGELAGGAAFWLRAGRLALTASDTDAAIACFSRSLALERSLGATPPTATSRARRREALAGREQAHRLQGDLAADAGDLDELQQLCGGEPARLADVSLRRAQRMLRLGDFANASVATVVAEDHASAAHDERLRGEALRVRGEILERLGRFDEALACVAAAQTLFHRQRAVTDEMAAMIGRGRIYLLRANYEAARAAYRPVLALIETTRDPWLERVAANHVAVTEMCLGNFTRAMESAQRSLELCRRYGDRAREGDSLSVAGIILLEVGMYDRAAATFREALDILARTSSRWSRADCLIYAGTCELRRGNPEGLAMIGEALDEARRLGARYLEANALIARAGAQLRRGSLPEAVRDAAEGTALAGASTLVGYEVQGLARHALALARSGGRAAEAATLADRALFLLDQQKHLEGSEEEVYAAAAEVYRFAGQTERADAVRDGGRLSARRKLDALADPAWRGAYLAIPEIRELLS